MRPRHEPARGHWLVGGAILLGALAALVLPSRSPQEPRAAGGPAAEGATRELDQARLEESLVRAESTAAMLRTLGRDPRPGSRP